MVIPHNITIAGIDIKVELDNKLMMEKGIVGCAVYEQQKIIIDPTIDGLDVLQQTFIHEVVHYILYVMGKQELRRDEEFVDGFAHLAYQIIKQLEKKQDSPDIPLIV
jgi:predicted SprT family Zn-dependent metalloprotease